MEIYTSRWNPVKKRYDIHPLNGSRIVDWAKTRIDVDAKIKALHKKQGAHQEVQTPKVTERIIKAASQKRYKPIRISVLKKIDEQYRSLGYGEKAQFFEQWGHRLNMNNQTIQTRLREYRRGGI